ncbi:Conidial yellow pigment biosynthesis polyketide synthase [Tolypocladium ophioglossoides CBS 100239]|uniref:Conidial yellow pigment biosynthesis polyketide synthase n=1 Tax=Tolypocladium ophioglossoides (strain CBS 100239) TaxID=1163406 RepID=A0A0L0N2K5_TOLOC|nr:Conidial yellow pigment biosynthesis polyketide synthase [Tolypocladium ophioglossoides CBS 100239]
MCDPLRRPLAAPAVLLFGPLALSFDYTHFAQVRKAVMNTADNKWIFEIVAQLPRLWNTITAALPSLQVEPGHGQLVDLAEAFLTGRSLETPSPLPNRLLIPLVVISHLTQYAQFLGRTGVEVDERIDPFEKTKYGKETLGFCTGLLSAFAVSSAGNRAEFETYGAVAIRLGMLIGMAVDVQDATTELKASKSLGTYWSSVQAKEEMLHILEDFPDTYVSVDYDENRATVKLAASAIRRLHQRLKAAGIVSSELGLHGRFHAECHRPIMASLLQFCDANPEFQFPDASKVVIPTRSNDRGDLISQGGLHCHALESILTEPLKWHQTFSALRQARLADKDALIISFGPERCIPPSHMLALSHQVVHLEDIDDFAASTPRDHLAISDNDIAVVGMSCKVAGAENLEEFWDLLCAAKSQHKEVPKERICFKTAFREVDPKRKWFANLIDGPDKFDHKFFKKSPRESATMDPQQRLLLQIAYQEVEQSGYFHSADPDRRIGCYIGLCASDYEGNVACHPSNAFSATGNLQGFAAGKVSHHFGWTGPGLTIDTACSSSAVAVHQACRAIISGECNAALAGGTHVMTSPVWFQNLAGASFLSTTGQCKPFDAKADGYCRGEGVGAVFLKKLSAAVSDGDQILGVVAATTVQQNQNCTPIFVPNVPSLSDLFRVVTKEARLLPNQITVIEAHGTGTAVGDPAEYDSIRQVFGGSVREKPLVVSSVKGLVGHVECTSGIVSMIKVLLMINKGMVPPQASFSTMNPAIKAVPADRMNVPTSLRSWETKFRAALVNNYGASGSNASMVLTESPLARLKPAIENSTETRAGLKYPFWLCGLDDQSLRRYSKALTIYLSRHAKSGKDHSVSNLAFNLARQSNRALDRGWIFSAQSVDELEQNLAIYNSGGASVSSARPASRPVVLCFGGQISTFVGLDRHLYEAMAVLRRHLDGVDAVARALGVGSIYPSIFERTPIRNIVKLQTVLFAIQYACSRSWIDSGLQPSAVVGHSFGELTALCISRVLSIEDTLKLIVGRAGLIQDAWGPEKGAMMAVEAEFADVEKLLADSSQSNNGTKLVTVACYNGPKSFTLAGPDSAINAVMDTMNKMPNTTPIRAKKLNVTNAFHCALVDPLMERLEESARGLTFREPTIPMERATEFPWQGKFTPKFVPDHMRMPVFFSHAVQRLAKRYPEAVFLEAGSCSTITTMASRALGNPSGSHFQAINITSDNGWNNLVDATVNLWKAGLSVQFWAHQAVQTARHTPLLLPPYQFDESSHWLELKAPSKEGEISEAPRSTQGVEKLPDSLLAFLGYQEGKDRVARFRVNTTNHQYDQFIAGHIIAQTAPICPSIVQLDMVVEAVRSICPEYAASQLEPQIHLVENQSPLCVNSARHVYIEIEEETAERSRSWNFRVLSTDGPKDTGKVMHTTGRIYFCAADNVSLKLELARLERLIGHQRYLEMMRSGDVDEILSHRNIYRIFSEIVEYSEDYRGLQKLVGQGNQSAGYVTKKHNTQSRVNDAYLTEAICQVGGIWVNCMTGRAPEDMFLANGIERWIRSPKLYQDGARPTVFHVLATHHRPSDKAFLTDVFVYDADDGSLVEAILGISFVKVAKTTMQKLLMRLTPGIGQKSLAADLPPLAPAKVDSYTAVKESRQPSQSAKPVEGLETPAPREEKKLPLKLDVAPKVKAILAELSGLELHEIRNDSGLADLGIDSLLGMEMAHEIEAAFEITLPTSELMEITDMPGLMKCVQKAAGSGAGTAHDSIEESACEDLDTSDSRSDSHSSTTSSDNQTVMTTPQDESDMDVGELKLSFDVVMEAFNEMKALTDERIAEYGQTGYVHMALPMQTQMCIALTLEAFEELGVPLHDAKPGQKFLRISHPKEHSRLVAYLYKMLEKESQLIIVDDTLITRTAVPYPTKSSKEVLQELLERFPDQDTANKLTFYTGSNLAQVLLGKTDGIKLVFGTAHGRELVSGLYGEWPLNRVFYKQMEDFLDRLASKLDDRDGPLKILEMGAGTAGTTRWLVPLLASLDVPVEYTFTDLAPSFVAAARKKFKPYPFMRYRTHDIEKAPQNDLVGTQHIIIASNAVHATHSLCESTGNMRKLLRPDGCLLMLEMTDTMYWVDMIFGLFEGWWFFDDGRTHAVTNEASWQKDLELVGYGHVDWTDAKRPENRVEKLIIAMASGPRCERLQIPSVSSRPADIVARQAVIDSYVRQFAGGFEAVIDNASAVGLAKSNSDGMCVVVTGATGSLGSHIAANLACRPDVARVVCLNRRSKLNPMERQRQALTTKGIFLSKDNLNKLHAFETDLSRPQLGLPCEDYEMILENATHIVHNAWLMNAKWPLKRFKGQLQMMRNLLDVAGTVSGRRPPEQTVTFQFANVPEERMTIETVLPTGYGDAKYICELMLDETLHRYPARFRAMVVRPGQVAGSSTSGYWNPMEHLSFMVKSSQTLKALPDLDGLLSWTPVDTVAGTLVDLVTLPEANTPYATYHIENPVRQQWKQTLPVLAHALDIPTQNMIPLAEWVQRVKDHPRGVKGPEGDNPAVLLIDFLEDNFVRMSCGGLLLDTTRAREHSKTLANCGPVGERVIRLFVQSWKDIGFLTPWKYLSMRRKMFVGLLWGAALS